MGTNGTPKTVADYIARFPQDIQRRLRKLRKIILAAAPGAGEAIHYRIPAFDLQGPLVYIAAFKDHVSFFPTSSGIRAFQRDAAPYITGKGTLRFSLTQPIPHALVERIVRFRVQENLAGSTTGAMDRTGTRPKTAGRKPANPTE